MEIYTCSFSLPGSPASAHPAQTHTHTQAHHNTGKNKHTSPDRHYLAARLSSGANQFYNYVPINVPAGNPILLEGRGRGRGKLDQIRFGACMKNS